MRLLVLIWLLALAPSAAAAAAAADPRELALATEMIARLHPALADPKLEPKPEEPLAVVVTGGPWREGTINLHRIHALCQRSTAEDSERTKQEFAAAVDPDMFATVVSDAFVFVGTMGEGPRLEEFKRSVAKDCDEQPRCISPSLYRFRDGRWIASPAAVHPEADTENDQ